MILGIDIEGKSDFIFFDGLIGRLAPDIQTREFISGGGIVPKLNDALAYFIDMEPQCDAAIFITDTDWDAHKCTATRKAVQLACETKGFPGYSVVCISPHMEAWLFKEENALKKFFGLPGDAPLVSSGKQDYKELLNTLIAQYGPEYITNSEVIAELVQLLDLNVLEARCAEFQAFRSLIVPYTRSPH